MNLTCIPNVGFFDSPEFVSLSLHIVTVFSAPIHLFGAYCILIKTPEQMKSVKWYMFTFHIWTVLFDLSLSFLVIPFILAPAAAGYPLGVLQWFGIPTIAQMLLTLTFFACEF